MIGIILTIIGIIVGIALLGCGVFVLIQYFSILSNTDSDWEGSEGLIRDGIILYGIVPIVLGTAFIYWFIYLL